MRELRPLQFPRDEVVFSMANPFVMPTTKQHRGGGCFARVSVWNILLGLTAPHYAVRPFH
jgi:hypothetical protein